MKDLILINPQNHYRGEVNPIGILNIKSVCDQLGYDVEILDMAKLQREENIPYNEKIFEWMEKIFKNLKARCYGISVMNASMFWGKTIAEIIRRYNSKAIIFAGGPQVTALKERIFEEGQEFDYLLLYEGEKGVPEFLKFIASDDKILPTNVLAKNLCNKDAYHIKMTAIDINNIKMIDYSNYLKQKIIDIEVGRGCLQFAPSSGHWCVCQRPLGGAQRPPLLRVFDRLNDNNVVLRCPLHYSVGRYFVIHDHRFPTPRFTLRTDDGTFGCFDAFFKDFHQYFDFPFIHDCI